MDFDWGREYFEWGQISTCYRNLREKTPQRSWFPLSDVIDALCNDVIVCRLWIGVIGGDQSSHTYRMSLLLKRHVLDEWGAFKL